MSSQALGPQFHYHSSYPENRESILKTGLKASAAQGPLGAERWEGYQGKAVYLSPRPVNFFTGETLDKPSPHQDVYRVNTAGMKLHRDPEMDQSTDLHQPAVFSKRSIRPDKVTLVKKAMRS